MRRWWQKVMDALGTPSVIPYALRHSSIVRAIGAGLPIRLVAALHDTSTAMIEKHYARWITESLDDIAARAIVSLVDADAAPGEPKQQPTGTRTVVPVRKRRIGRPPRVASAA